MQVDGVTYKVLWKKFTIGASFFIPCIHKELSKTQIRNMTRELGFTVVMKLVIEDGVRGLRVWRVK